MDVSKRFSYRSLAELTEAIASRGHALPASEDVSALAQSARLGRLTAPNRLACQPMEGCDGLPDGSPSELTIRKYRRLGGGGAGLIWFEACAIVPEGRANPRQISLKKDNVEAFAEMVRQTKQAARDAGGPEPVCVLQMTHSGRYSRPEGTAAPIIAHHSAVLDPRHDLPADYPLITDEQLDKLQDAYVAQAILAAEAGFDAVDVKACHRYLINELLASFTRTDSRYGGDYENRTRLLRETVAKVKNALGSGIEVMCRLNAFDAIAHPYGWGVSVGDANQPELSEPIRLVGELRDAGLAAVNITIGNPYFNPYVNRPADWMIADWPDPPEDPLTGVVRILEVVRDIQRAHPDLPVIGSGYSWLRHYAANIAAGTVGEGWATIAGFGRGALAYPNFARDILTKGHMDRHKVCVACSSCTQIMRDGGTSGCVVRDPEIYAPIFRAGRRRDPATLKNLAARCRRCPDAMCTSRCPAGVDIPGFLGALADGREHEAYDILRSENVLPEICGFVCPVEVQCQSGCIRRQLDEDAVPIGEIQRYLSQRAVEAGWAKIDTPAEASGKSVTVIGAGPAGLAAAAELLKLGHCVTVFEARKQIGGKANGVIPAARLPLERAQAEMHALFESVPQERLTWRLGEALGPERTLDNILAGSDAAVLAMGLGAAMSLAGKATQPQGVVEANDFLRQMNGNPSHACGPKVAVVGGGNTAMDAAVMATTRGAQDVFLVYRRSYSQMPAWPGERNAALEAGVHPLVLCRPVRYITDNAGRVSGIELLRTELGQADASQLRSPVDIPGSEHVLSVDLVIEAIGEKADADLSAALGGVEFADGVVRVDPQTLATTRPGVWAAGDVVNGGQTVVQAVADGKKAADHVDAYLRSSARKGT